jgi:hypothetical protein
MQRIDVNIGVPSGGYSLKILAIYQLENKLIVVNKITTPNGASSSSMDQLHDMAIVKTGSQEPLEVVNYLINNKKNRQPFTSRAFKAVANEDDIKDFVSNGKLLYKPRFDHCFVC